MDIKERLFVDIGRYVGDEFIISVRCFWDGGDSPVYFEGPDSDLIDDLKDGFEGALGEFFTPADGRRFLYALSEAFRNQNLFASSVKKGDPGSK